MAMISPSILAADFAKLGEDVADVCAKGADYLHIDVMDGAFVPNISFGAGVMKSLNGIATIPYDVHLMIQKPDRYLEDFMTDNTEYIIVHYEACDNLAETLDHIHRIGAKAGVSVKPGTDAAVLDDYLGDIDQILVMSVEPGFGGQKFMPDQVAKVEYYDARRKTEGYNYIISIDGACTLKDDGQLNALIIPEEGSEDFSYMAYDKFPVRTVAEHQAAGERSYYIRWGDNRVRVLRRGVEFSLCRHIPTGYEMEILTKYLYTDEEETTCNDSTDLILELHPGDEVSVVEETSRGYFVKHRGTSGWYYGKLL